jgi:hypothetical protein
LSFLAGAWPAGVGDGSVPDGALAQSRLERGPAAATAAKAAAQVLIDGAFPAARKPQS